jgi:outer membrane protein assembly factor BamB
LSVPGGATTNPVVADGTLYLVSRDGRLHAFR